MSLIAFIAVIFIVQLLGYFWTEESVNTWYTTLNKPSWTPPNWLFGPVWTVLYLLIAVSGWLIYRKPRSMMRTIALGFWGLQLVLNLLWSYFFFAQQSPGLGLMDIIALCLSICLTISCAWNVSRLASLLLIPYLLWVLYATALNTSIWLFNP